MPRKFLYIALSKAASQLKTFFEHLDCLAKITGSTSIAFY